MLKRFYLVFYILPTFSIQFILYLPTGLALILSSLTCHCFQIIHDIQIFKSTVTFHFFAAFPSWLVSSPLWLPSFVKCHTDLPLEDKEVTQLHPLLSMQELNNRHTVTNLQQTSRGVTWLVTDHNGHLLITYWFLNWRASIEVYALHNNWEFTYHSKWHLKCVVRGLVLLNKTVATELQAKWGLTTQRKKYLDVENICCHICDRSQKWP